MEEQVTLEAYADQNRALIHNQRNNEALAICKHILRYFPKHLETYRQMGEAYLNLEDLESAMDMFRRVLSADPEDLVAYIGLSTVFEQRRLYEEAIWHLERAYELAPENVEIQKELLRLYPEIGMRNQQRVQMTPGALARLYTREGLYPQALQELRLVFAQSSTRFDANIALAETLWHAGQLGEAAQVSEKLLAQLPYCLKANLILGTVWKESGVTEGDLHLQRAQEVDPTNLVAQKVLGSRSTLPVLQVAVPRYVEGAMPVTPPMPAQPTASTQSVALEKEAWSFDEPTAENTSEAADFFSTTPSLFDAQPASAETVQALPREPSPYDNTASELPDWLTAEFPVSPETAKTAEITSGDEQTSLEAWFSETQAAEKSESATDQVSTAQVEDLLAQLISGTSTEPSTTETPPPAETNEPSATPAEEIPEWLKGWQVAPEETTPTTQTSGTESTTPQTQELPAWLRGLETMEEKTATEIIEPSVSQAEELPDWIQGLQPVSEEPIAPVAEEKLAPTEELAPPTVEWTSAPPVVEEKSEPSSEQSFADFLTNLGQETTTLSVPETTTPEAQRPAAQPAEFSLPDFPTSAPVEEKPSVSSESHPIPGFLETQAPSTPAQTHLPDELTSPREEWVTPEMPPTPSPVDTAPSIVVETPPAPIVRPRKPKRAPKGSERLARAREYRSEEKMDKALAEYDYIVQRAPRLIKEVIDDLEVWIQRIDAPLDAHRILGDAYMRGDRLNDALERYHFVMEHSPKASE